jgi:AraC-like DNA-binding protein
VSSWTNATAAEPTARGVLRPAETARVADLRREAPVAEALRPFVERYWSVRWDLTGRPPFRSEVLSHPSVNVSVEDGTHPRFGVRLPAVLLHGVVTRRFAVDLVGAGRVVAVKFRPGGFAVFTGARPARNSVGPLRGELAVDAGRLLREVLAEDDGLAAAGVLDAALSPLAPAPTQPYLQLQAMLEAMAGDRRLIRVDQVAELGGVSVRSLQRLFATLVGVTPKAVLARYRLQDAAAAIDAGTVDDLAALAVELGWFDQAHFSRDFRSAVGTTPSAYLQQARSAS